MNKPNNENLSIMFWDKESGNSLSHNKGLDERHLAALKNLKAGDRLILFRNREKRSETDPDFTLKVCGPLPPKKQEPEDECL